ncbi:31615_t:CDS:2, partial [Gigaspora margarita]
RTFIIEGKRQDSTSLLQVSNYKKQKVQDLYCIFKDLVKKYNQTGLSTCEIEDCKKWNTTCQKAAKQLTFFKPYFPELSNLFLENYPLCLTYYNQTPSYTDLMAKLNVTKIILENVKQKNIELCKKTKQTWQYLEEQARKTEELAK